MIPNTPGTSDVFSNGAPRPGVDVSTNGYISLRNPRTGVAWGNSANARPNIGFDPDGLPSANKSVREFMSNTFVQQQYLVSRWKNRSEMSLIEGQFVFAHRTTPKSIKLPSTRAGYGAPRFQKKDLNSYIVFNLPHVNGLLHNAESQLQTNANAFVPNGRNSKIVAQSHEVRTLRAKISEDEFTAYVRARSSPKDLAQYANDTKDEDVPGNKEFERLYELSKEHNFCYVICPQLVYQQINFLGSIQNMNYSTEGNHPNTTAGVGTVIANVVLAKKATVHNVFQPCTEVDSGSKLFFILTRKRLADGRVGPFVFEPIALKHNEMPPVSMKQYRDNSGALCYGLVRPIGYVQLPGNRLPNRARQQVASGVRPPTNFEQPKRATMVLPTIQIQIDMNI